MFRPDKVLAEILKQRRLKKLWDSIPPEYQKAILALAMAYAKGMIESKARK